MSQIPTYGPLSIEKKEIRVLYIQDFVSGQPYGYEEQCISGRLVHISLADEHLPYYALSYVWGDPAPVSAVILPHGACIPLGRNLLFALSEIQRNNFLPVDLSIWIDAVCINQKDLAEKSWQVAQMDAIYSAAAKTLISLGAPGVNSRQTMQFLNDVGERVLEIWKDSVHQAWLSIPMLDEMENNAKNYDRIPGGLGIRRTLWNLWGRHRNQSALSQVNMVIGSPPSLSGKDIVDFIRLPWWERVWVLQELILSRSPWFVHGDKAVAAERVVASLLFMGEIHHHLLQFIVRQFPAPKITLLGGFVDEWRTCGPESEMNLRSVIAVPAVRLYCDQRIRKSVPWYSPPGAVVTGLESWTLGFVLINVRKRLVTAKALRATNPIDQIYALLGLVKSWPNQAPLSPDYTLSPNEVFSKATVLMLELTISTTRTFLRPATFPKTLPNVASWVPDWSVDWPDIELARFDSFDKVQQKVLYNGRHLLTISGTVFGRIETRETPFDAFRSPNEDLFDSAEAIYGWLRSLHIFSPDVPALLNTEKHLNQDKLVVMAFSLVERVRREFYLAHLLPNPNVSIIDDEINIFGTRWVRDIEELIEALSMALGTCSNMKLYGKEPKVFPRLHRHVERAIEEHHLENTIIQTDKGYVGLTRDTVRKGDLLVQFDIDLGIHFIVRPREDLYELVSMAYVPQLFRDPSIQGNRMEFTLC
ncbi:uncharacterized protein N0V89_004800 [Didymosphaeria variabile]|uniref:Heterokaryon incompatibility domain-containing protein n=1 Tax=Didymosphaeria variabile TaxID=1932322 RepID=A0A9W8XQK1_9PLEO|nr:uncharacterized protein N0V89_004800 [Didymosphaeria variabile]KAJ4356764.1 hypothetical protein N0V89_004800 [Didymosphaeria variabile]